MISLSREHRLVATAKTQAGSHNAQVLLISPHFEWAWHEYTSVHMFVQVQACTCTSTLSDNAPHAYASRSRFTLTLIWSEVKSTAQYPEHSLALGHVYVCLPISVGTIHQTKIIGVNASTKSLANDWNYPTLNMIRYSTCSLPLSMLLTQVTGNHQARHNIPLPYTHRAQEDLTDTSI